MENLRLHQQKMANALQQVDQLFNLLNTPAREKECARENFGVTQYWLGRLYARLEAEINAIVTPDQPTPPSDLPEITEEKAQTVKEAESTNESQ